jgi:hypothetical protein
MARWTLKDLFPPSPISHGGKVAGPRPGKQSQAAEQLVQGRRGQRERGTAVDQEVAQPASAGGPPAASLADQDINPDAEAELGEPTVALNQYPMSVWPKARRYPPKDSKTHRVPVLTTSSNSAVLIDTDVGFMIRSYQIENYSGIWLKVDPVEKWIPPNFAVAFVAVAQRSQRLVIIAQAPPGTTQNAATAGQQIMVTVSEGDDAAIEIYLGL